MTLGQYLTTHRGSSFTLYQQGEVTEAGTPGQDLAARYPRAVLRSRISRARLKTGGETIYVRRTETPFILIREVA